MNIHYGDIYAPYRQRELMAIFNNIPPDTVSDGPKVTGPIENLTQVFF